MFRSDSFDVPDAVAAFLVSMAKNNIIQFSDIPVECIIEIKGSINHFTPLHFAIELTDHCNLFCKHCYRKSGPALDNFLPTEKLLSLLDDMKNHGVTSVELTGGEPMTHPDFLKFYKKANELFDRIGVVSNGVLIDKQIIDAFSAGDDNVVVQIDLDGDNAKAHDSLRGIPGSFNKTLAAAKMMTSCGIKFRVVMNVYPGNLSRVRQTASLARAIGAHRFSFASVLMVGRALEMEDFNHAELIELKNLVDDLEKAYPEFIQVSIKPEENSFFHKSGNCGGGSRSLVLGPTGNVRPCPMLGEEYGIFGNLLRDDYETVINNAPLEEHYHLQMPDEAFCHKCDYLYFCKGCFSRPYHACADAKRKQKTHSCYWNEKTNYFELMKKYQN